MTTAPALATESTALRLADAPSPASTPTAPRLGLTELDRLAATALATGDVRALIEQVRARAEALAGIDGDDAAARVLGRRIAVVESGVELLEALIGRCVGARDFDALPHLESLLRLYGAQLVRLVEAHGIQRRLARRSVVVIAADAGLR